VKCRLNVGDAGVVEFIKNLNLANNLIVKLLDFSIIQFTASIEDFDIELRKEISAPGKPAVGPQE